jgi:hypothetical protein
MGKGHEHSWEVQHHVFPEEDAEPGTYEDDSPYTIFYCACGERKLELMSQDEVNEVRLAHGLPAMEVS